MEYRIVEETGNLTGNKRFYIEEKKKKWFGMSYYWKALYYRADDKLVVFDTKKEATEWINYKTETIKNIYH